MSTTVINPAGVQTRQSRIRNNSDTLASIGEMAATIDNLSTRRRGTKRTISTSLPVSSDQDDVPTSPDVDNVFPSPESIAIQVWTHMFQGHAFEKLTQSTNYMRIVIPGILDSSTIGIIKTKVTAFLESRKSAFTSTRERDADKLRKRLYKIFTNGLIREVKAQLVKEKQKIEERVSEMAANKLERQKALDLYKAKERQAKLALDKASEASQDLLEATNKALSEETSDENSLPADNHEILTLLADFLTKEAESDTLALPEIQDDPKDTSNPKELSRDEFNTLPQDIQDKFTQVEQLID